MQDKMTPDRLLNLAWEYIQECENNTKQHPTASGKVVSLKDRHIPTINYFLRVWIPSKRVKTIARSTYYLWLKDQEKSDTIKKVEELFEALATDIVANEGKGIFYAKNKLGMSDKTTFDHVEQPFFQIVEK